MIEEQADGKIQYAFSNLPAGTSRIQAVRLWKSRWPVEQGYQQMKEELGLNHFEGRSWRGFHHHACLVMLAYGFLVLEQLREKEAPASPGKKSEPAPTDHRAGDPPGLAAIAEADGEAGLQLLQSILSFVDSTLPNLNGVVLKSVPKALCCGPSPWSLVPKPIPVLRPGQPTEHQLNHADPDLRLAGISQVFIILAVNPAPTQPAEGSLHHPPPRQQLIELQVSRFLSGSGFGILSIM